MRSLLRLVYGSYVWLVFLVLAHGTLLVALFAPGVDRSRRIARGGARLFLALAGLRPRVVGLERLPAGASVVVANHASYLDGIVMQAVLPPRFAFVIKREMVRVPLASVLLRKIGSEFVERFDHQKSALDARRVLKTAAGGQALGFFPEGTFVARPGLGHFHVGAFKAAVRAGLPVVPTVIRGTRAVLPAGRFLAAPGRIEVELMPPLPPPAPDQPDGVARLRTAARSAILSRLGEPDLDAAKAADAA